MDFGQLVSAVRISSCGGNGSQMARELALYAPPDEPPTAMHIVRWSRGEYPPSLAWLAWVRDNAPADSWQHDFAERVLSLRLGEFTNKQPVS